MFEAKCPPFLASFQCFVEAGKIIKPMVTPHLFGHVCFGKLERSRLLVNGQDLFYHKKLHFLSSGIQEGHKFKTSKPHYPQSRFSPERGCFGSKWFGFFWSKGQRKESDAIQLLLGRRPFKLRSGFVEKPQSNIPSETQAPMSKRESLAQGHVCTSRFRPQLSARAHKGAPVPVHTVSNINVCVCSPSF